MLTADTFCTGSPVIPDIVAACVFLLLNSDTAKVFLMVVSEILNLGRAQWIFVQDAYIYIYQLVHISLTLHTSNINR